MPTPNGARAGGSRRNPTMALFAALFTTWCGTLPLPAHGQEPPGSNTPFLDWLGPQASGPASVTRNWMDPTDWRRAMDETWGEGQPTEEKLLVFDTFWKTVDEQFACFQGLNVDWPGLR